MLTTVCHGNWQLTSDSLGTYFSICIYKSPLVDFQYKFLFPATKDEIQINSPGSVFSTQKYPQLEILSHHFIPISPVYQSSCTVPRKALGSPGIIK